MGQLHRLAVLEVKGLVLCQGSYAGQEHTPSIPLEGGI